MDAADVPLQRLVLPVVDLGRRRHACVPARRAGAGDVRRDRKPQGDASVRRPDRDGDFAQCAGEREEAFAPRGRILHGRGAAAGNDDVLRAILELDIAVGMHHAEIAGVKPAASEGPLGGGLVLEIAFHHDVAAHHHFAQGFAVARNRVHVAVIFNPQHFDDEVTFAQRGAESLGIKLTTHPINSAADLDPALRTASAQGTESLFIISSRLTGILAAEIAQYGQERRLPVIASWREFAASGALLSYGPSRVFEAKRLVGYVQKVLSGAKPADLPIEQPVKFELVINLKTAKALGLNVPLPLLDRADELIE